MMSEWVQAHSDKSVFGRRSKDRKLGISMSELTSMLNIGKEMERKLISVGIKSSEELIDIGAKDAFLRLKQKYPNVCLVHLYTLEGAVHDIEYNRLSEDTKKELKEFSDFLKR